MLDNITNKLSNGMLWCLVLPTAFLIIMLSLLIHAYSSVVSRSDKIIVENSLGKVTASVENLQSQLDDLISANKQLKLSNDSLQKALNELNKVASSPVSSNHPSSVTLPPSKPSDRSVKENNLANSLDLQAGMIDSQRIKLESVNHDISKFKLELKKILPATNSEKSNLDSK